MSIQSLSRNRVPYDLQPAIPPAPSLVAKGSSRPADPLSSSFLRLPGELRNAIYTFALAFPHPLIIADGRLYRHVEDANDDLIAVQGYHDRGHTQHKKFLNENFSNWGLTSYELARVAHPGLGLFLTCRQVFHESCSVFFGNNVFTFSTFRDEDEIDHDARATFLDKGAAWLTNLGSQLAQVKKVVVDMGSLCPERCHSADDAIMDCVYSDPRIGSACIEIFPLLRVIWSRNWHGNITFASCNRPTCPDGSVNHRVYEPTYDESGFGALTQTVRFLRRDDLDIKKAMPLICHIAVARDGQRGVVIFRSTHRPFCLPQSYFRPRIKGADLWHYHPCLGSPLIFAANDDKLITTQTTPHLLGFPKYLEKRIVHLVLQSREEVMVNLDTEKEVVPGLLYISRFVYAWSNRFYYTANEFILIHSVSMDDPKTLANRLERWISSNRYSATTPIEMAEMKGRNVREIRFVYTSPDDTSCALTQLRIDVTPLMRHATYLGSGTSTGHAEIHVASWKTGSDGSKVLVNQASFEFGALLRAVGRFLSVDIDGWIDPRITGTSDVIIDGLGAVLSARAFRSDWPHSLRN
ncbi:hypothetical protein P153DRAFT_397814 [Dothidotthia symphoricarpi CBS 119687]|uniref:DUF7730 domain-containing protein n=1 Tax=Dothidotthia symphoricarpi CBS 119687 TaxID=1392245 RepID=A0A6A6A7W6_9PLEO|nr:uncharacterized protein P153DRAFT_397814 [Dothidotthia symphoricarpi CBS 119687]KAF2127920.1 hypothetical protein P153DRAFT_397814 [Dothidotthia symphoricarpi CBS 119687]